MPKNNPLKIALVNMPWASLSTPSLALTQLSSVVNARFGENVSIETHYLNHDFALRMENFEWYGQMTSHFGYLTGAGDWFFRQAAFPDAPDNTDDYLDRYCYGESPEAQTLRHMTKAWRPEINNVLNDLITEHHLDEADIVGFTSLFYQSTASFAMARLLKEKNRDLITVMGGPSCEGDAGHELAKQVSAIDYFFSGPSLVSFPELVQNLIDGNIDACENIKGVFTQTNASGDTNSGVTIGESMDINEVVPLDYNCFLNSFKTRFGETGMAPRLFLETSRGCWWAEKKPCSFCGLNGLTTCYQSMTPDKAIAHMKSVFEYKPDCSYFESVDNVIPNNYFDEVLPRVKPPEGTKIQYEVRPNLDEKQIEALNDSCITVLQPGIESLSTDTLKLMKKGLTAFGNIRFLKTCSRYPFNLGWNLLVYSPGESEETYEKYQQDIPLLTHLHPPLGAFMIAFMRFSHYFENPEEHNLDLHPEDFYGMTYPFDDAAVSRIAYRFSDANADTESMKGWLERLNELVAVWQNRWTGQDGSPAARLCFLENSSILYDSRSGEEIEHEIGPETRSLLDLLKQPHSVEQAGKALGPDAAQEIAFLSERGLLFEEHGRYLSLVV